MRCAFASQAAELPPAEAGPTAIALLRRDRQRDCAVLDSGAEPIDVSRLVAISLTLKSTAFN